MRVKRGQGQLLVLSQVAISLTLPFLLLPLAYFPCDGRLMRPLPVRRIMLGGVELLVAVLTDLNFWIAVTA